MATIVVAITVTAARIGEKPGVIMNNSSGSDGTRPDKKEDNDNIDDDGGGSKAQYKDEGG